MAGYTEKLTKIDLSKLEVTQDAEGRKIMRLPEDVAPSSIKEDIRNFDEKKVALLKKFPQFDSFREDMREKYFQECIQNSVNVKSKFLELGINTSRPKLKNGAECNTQYYDSYNYFFGHLYNTTHAEVVFIGFTDGTYAIYECTDFAYNYSYYTGFGRHPSTGALYYLDNGKAVSWMGHSHMYNSTPTDPEDYDARDTYWGVNHYVFYDGTFYPY